ncbi:hypothetical protein F8388_009112, partial [Cannabis sativa]
GVRDQLVAVGKELNTSIRSCIVMECPAFEIQLDLLFIFLFDHVHCVCFAVKSEKIYTWMEEGDCCYELDFMGGFVDSRVVFEKKATKGIELQPKLN